MREKRLELLRLSAVASKTTVATVTPLSQLNSVFKVRGEAFLNHPLTIARLGRRVKGGKPSQKYGFHGEQAEFLESER